MFDLNVQAGIISHFAWHTFPDCTPITRQAEIASRLTQAVVGLSAELTEESLTAHLQAAVPYPVRLTSTRLQDLAKRLRQQLDQLACPTDRTRLGRFTAAEVENVTASWRGLNWRIIPEHPAGVHQHLALDELFLDDLARGSTSASLRFWGWTEPSLILGRSQKAHAEYDPSVGSVRVGRRISGGGTMFAEPGGTITYSVILPEAAVSGYSIRASYELLDAWVILALRELGVEVCHVPINDLACSRGKIAGSAQARRHGVVLHHTTLAYQMDVEYVARLLRTGAERVASRGVPSAAKWIAPLNHQTTRPREQVVAFLLQAFQARYGGELLPLLPEEARAAEERAREKYSTADWLGENA
jgi:lipoate-protein ligase A